MGLSRVIHGGRRVVVRSPLRHVVTSTYPQCTTNVSKALFSTSVSSIEDSIRELNRETNAFVTDALSDRDRHQASLLASGTTGPGPLHGKLIAIKDNICTADYPTTAASLMLDKHVPLYDATCVTRLRDAEAVIIGKTNMDEFGMGSRSVYSHHGPVVNPISTRKGKEGRSISNSRSSSSSSSSISSMGGSSSGNNDDGVVMSAGGSSGGSALSVARGVAHVALGSDTGGSVRQPAALTGILGFKPSYGRISRHGLISYGSSLDTIGILANTVPDIATVCDVISGQDPLDSTSLPRPPTRALRAVQERISGRGISTRLQGIRVGVPKEYSVTELEPSIRQAWNDACESLVAQGATVIPISLPSSKHAVPVYYIIASAEASSNLSRYDGLRYGYRGTGDTLEGLACDTRGTGFGREVQRRILTGTFVLTSEAYQAFFHKAQQVRRLIAEEFDAAFSSNDNGSNGGDDGGDGVHVMLTPTTATQSLGLDASSDPAQEYSTDAMTVACNLTGLPAISVPRRVGTGTAAVQCIGPMEGDEMVLQVAACLVE